MLIIFVYPYAFRRIDDVFTYSRNNRLPELVNSHQWRLMCVRLISRNVITEGSSGICLNTADAFVITGAGGGLRLWATTLWLCSRVWPNSYINIIGL